MIVVIAGCNGSQDLSGSVDRGAGMQISSVISNRIDTLTLTLFDPNGTLVVPPRAEIVVYDADPSILPAGWTWGGRGPIVDPPSSPSSAWTPRLFGGFVATRRVYMSGAHRYWEITAQDYTVWLKQTVANRAYSADGTHPNGWTDGQIVRDIFARYRPEFDTSLVNDIVTSMPPISFPTHTLEQFLQRVVKISRAVYRVNYYKQVTYWSVGTSPAPFGISDSPNYGSGSPPTFGAEHVQYDPDDSALFNRVWVIGGQMLGVQQTIRVGTGDGNQWTFPLPAVVDKVSQASVSLAGVDQGVLGQMPTDGTLDSQANFARAVLVSATPPILAFRTTPPAGASIVITAQFRYPLIQIVSDPALISAMSGRVFEYVLRDKRITNQPLAIVAGQQAIQTQGYTRAGGSCVVKKRGWNGKLLEPGQNIAITNAAVFRGILPNGSTTFNALIRGITLTLTDDTTDPYEVTINFADRP